MKLPAIIRVPLAILWHVAGMLAEAYKSRPVEDVEFIYHHGWEEDIR